MLKLKYKLVGDRFLHLACQGAIRPSALRQLHHWLWCCIYIL